jgi:hypothetical protein
MKNKHLVLLFLVITALVWYYQSQRASGSKSITDERLATEFVARCKNVEKIEISDGIDPNIEVQLDEHGWRLGFGNINSSADEDSIKAFIEALSKSRVTQLPISRVQAKADLLIQGKNYHIERHEKDTLMLSTLDGGVRVGLITKSAAWLNKPYTNWLFRRLQVAKMDDFTSLSYVWKDFPKKTYTKIDSIWTSNSTQKPSAKFMSDTLLPALTMLNLLEPTENFDPITESTKPFCTLYLNDGTSGELMCYRRTEHTSEYFISAKHLPHLIFQLPKDLANLIFVKPMLAH